MGGPNASQIDALLRDLSRALLAEDAFNPYAPGDGDNAIRRDNLRRYLHTMAARSPQTLLVMEAPGYRGCRLTGIPVTSRKLMLEGWPRLGVFGRGAGFQDVADSGFERVYGEQSATIVWTALADLGALPLIWNAFPFHPHKPGQPRSNRKPRAAEIETGAVFLRRILELWDFAQIIAVGNVAHETMRGMGLDCPKARHPAHGGKAEFVAAMNALLSSGG